MAALSIRGALPHRPMKLSARPGNHLPPPPSSATVNPNARRSFTISPSLHSRKGLTRHRKAMWVWLRGPGKQYKTPPAESGPHYLPSRNWDLRVDPLHRPFPLNDHFTSDPVLSLPLRDDIYRRVVEQGQTVREVSQALRVSMERVGAVVRLKTVENDFVRQDLPMAKPYQRAILAMLPQTRPAPPGSKVRHEPINNLPVHRATLPQLFAPVSESRVYTRADAAAAFSRTLRTADERIPHTDMIASQRDQHAAMSESQRRTRQHQRWDDEMTARDEERARLESRRQRREINVPAERFDFRFTKVQIDEARDPRSRQGVGWRYGHPLEDRKKGRVWIPTSVE